MLSITHRIPNGVLVIFPSYSMMNNFKEELKGDRELMEEFAGLKELCF